MALNPNIPLGSNIRPIQGPLASIMQAAPVANAFKQQRQQEQIADIFARNVGIDEQGIKTLDKPNTLAELFGVDPQFALDMEDKWAQVQETEKKFDHRKKIRDDISFTSQILSGTTNPTLATETLSRAGIGLGDMPPIGTPEWQDWKKNKISMGVERKDIASMNVKDREASVKEGGLTIKKAKEVRSIQDNIRKHVQLSIAKSEEIIGINDFIDLAESISSNKNLKLVTGAGRFVSFVPGTPAADLETNRLRLVAMGAISTMAKLKSLSPTGSTGFGALSDNELKTIQNAFASLSTNQTPTAMRRELGRITKVMRKYIKNINKFETESRAIMNKMGVPLGYELNLSSPDAPSTQSNNLPSFATEAEARAAGHGAGDPVIINGVKGKLD